MFRYLPAPASLQLSTAGSLVSASSGPNASKLEMASVVMNSLLRAKRRNPVRRHRAWPLALVIFVTLLAGATCATAAPADFIHADGTRLVDGPATASTSKASISATGWFPKATCSSSTRPRAEGDRRRHFSADRTRAGGAVLERIPRRLCRRGRHPLHQGGRLQHRARAAALAAFRDAAATAGRTASRARAGDCSTAWCHGAAPLGCASSSTCTRRLAGRPASTTMTAPASR